MRILRKEAKVSNSNALEQKLATALAALKPFRLSKSWIRVPKTDSEIGVGGFGVVHRAILQKWPFGPKVHVAVKKFHTIGEWDKLLHVAFALVQELDVWAKLDHPNILPLLGFHLSSGLEEAWLVSPYATNGNVFEYLEKTHPELDARLELAKDTAKGLEYLHTRSPPICHGDIKSLNVLINLSGQAMLCDFGLAKATDTATVSTESKSTNDGGTVRYWSPELFEDDSHPTLKSDVWAWGCLVLEIITSLSPYHDILLEGRLIHVISNGTLPATLDDSIPCPLHIRDLLRLCWERESGSRPDMTQAVASLTAGNIKFYRSESFLLAPSITSTHLDNMERELSGVLAPLEHRRVNPAWFDFPKFGSAIGFGGFGVVHRAVMRPTWRSRAVTVAVKKLRAMGGRDKCLRMATALIREIAVWADLSHPNIIPFIGFHLSSRLDEAWLVAPYMANGNLSQYLLTVQLAVTGRLELALDTARGLQYLHNRDPPICHGDIKALNVLINGERRAILCDFGLAKTMENMPSGLTTSTFNQAGSLAYESPELLLGVSLRSPESDVWAWGCLLQEIFSGKTPYHWANNPGAIVKWITQDIPPAVVEDIECTSFVRRLMGMCWQSRIDFRPSMDQCITVLADDLSQLLDDAQEGDASRVLEELESKQASIFHGCDIESFNLNPLQKVLSVEDLVVQRSSLNFSEASKIGSGSFGAMYKGQMSLGPPRLDQVVAIKQLLPVGDGTGISDDVVQRIVSQLRLKHFNVLQITGYCADPSPSGELLLVFPYLVMGSLDTYLKSNVLNDTKKTALATEIAEGLLYLHTRSPPISHGRLHPHNILIADTGHPLLCDYGLDVFATYFRETQPAVESLRYQSPETVTRSSSGTPRGDAWSWGCVFLLIVSGHVPHRDCTEIDSLRQRLEQKIDPTRLDDLDCQARDANLLGMCWAWDPESRPPMSDVVAILTGRQFKFAKAWSTPLENLLGLRFSRDGELLALGHPKSITVHNTRTGDLEYELVQPETDTGLRVMQFSYSGRLLVGLKDPDVVVWDLTKREVREVRPLGRRDLVSTDISSDDTFCATGCEDGTILVWDLDDKEKTRSHSMKSPLRAIAISPGREVLAVGIRNTGVLVVSIDTFEILATFHCGWIWSVRFSPDSRLLFGACGDRIARCWNVGNLQKGKLKEGESTASGLEFSGHGAIISSVSGNSDWFMSISDGGEVRAVNLATDSASGKAQQIGSISATSIVCRMDLTPVSEEGTGYAVAHPGGSGDIVVWKYASLLHRNAYRF